VLFLSQLIGTAVYDNTDEKVGRIQDVIVKPHADNPQLVGLEIVSGKMKLFVDYKFVESLGEKLSTLNIAQKKLKTFHPHEGDIFLSRDLLERQIVDLAGAKLVRVNDIQLGKVGSKLCLISLAVGSKAIFRRLGVVIVADLFRLHDKFIQWKDVNLVDFTGRSKSNLQLRTLRDELSQLHPADIANIIEDLNAQQSKQLIEALSDVSEELAADVLEEIDEPRRLRSIMMDMPADKAAGIVEEMEPDEAADLMAHLPEEKAEELLELMEEEGSQEVEDLLSYEEGTAGALMSTGFVSVPLDYSVQQTVTYIKKISSEFDSIYYVYAVDKQGVLKGVVSIRTLLIETRTKKIKDLIQPKMITVHVDSGHEEILKKLTKYDLLSICVVDHKKKLLGIVTVDDALRLLVPEA